MVIKSQDNFYEDIRSAFPSEKASYNLVENLPTSLFYPEKTIFYEPVCVSMNIRNPF
jgi:hypothetical protein